MGTSWNYFKQYKIEQYCDEIEYLDGDCFNINYQTSGLLAEMLEQFNGLLPVYDTYNAPISKKLDGLVEPLIIADAARKSMELLERFDNPLIEDATGDKYPLFDEDDLTMDSTKQLNENIMYYLEKILRFSEQGFYFVREQD